MRKALALFLVVMSPALLLGEPINSAMLVSNGNVYVNGARVTPTANLFPGDSVTIRDGIGRVSRPGLNAVLGQGSEATWSQNGITINRGAADINFNQNAHVEFAGLTLIPQGQEARVLVKMQNGVRLISAMSGSVRVSDGLHAVVIPAGYTLRDVANPQNNNQNNQNNNQNQGNGTGQNTQGTTPGTKSPGKGWVWNSTLGKWVLASTVIGGTLGGLAAAGAFSPSPASAIK